MNTYECNFDLDIKDRAMLLSLATQLDYDVYITNKGTTTGLNYTSTVRNVPVTGVVKKLISMLNSDINFTGAVFVHFFPNDSIFPHSDDDSLRASCITWALAPSINNFAPVNYYTECNEEAYEETVYYSKKPLIINTSNYHSVHNNNFNRYTFQLCSNDPIEKLVELDKKNELFSI